MPPSQVAINLGGEGEIPGVINQQGPWVLLPSWWSSRDGKPFLELAKDHAFLICSNTSLPFLDDSVDVVYTNGVPIDLDTHLGPGVQSSEIRRILKPGGKWIHDGNVVWTKP